MPASGTTRSARSVGQKTGATFELEDALVPDYGSPVAGVDEAGRGPLAGPVVAAAVILDRQAVPPGLADSKALSAAARQTLFDAICRTASVSVAMASVRQIDAMNIREATLSAMTQAARGLATNPACVLIDGRDVPPGLPCPGASAIKGDARSLSVAAASIVAKVTRDRLMCTLDGCYPGYGFNRHMGYGTKIHLEALDRLGPCAIHRTSFRPVADLLERS
ncbi:MAG: ribonuclease HII [Pseudomonadota bacterium]